MVRGRTLLLIGMLCNESEQHRRPRARLSRTFLGLEVGKKRLRCLRSCDYRERDLTPWRSVVLM